MSIAQDSDMPGYEEFEKQAWGFKVRVSCSLNSTSTHIPFQHDRLGVERRIANASSGEGVGASILGDIKTSDIARLMELFQVSSALFFASVPSIDHRLRRAPS